MSDSRASVKAAQAASFDSAADTYERARPGYPEDAVNWLLQPAPQDVVDLGAGTGKLTRALVGKVASITAVDPSPKMLAQLRAAVPTAQVVVGTAEDLPLADDSADAILVAQAWHWVDPDRALPEARRVLRKSGYLGLIWNVRDESIDWVARLSEIMQGSEAEKFVAEGDGIPTELARSLNGGEFGAVERHLSNWERPFDRASLLELVASRSYLITATEPVRADIFRRVGELLDTHPDLADPASWRMPYRTESFRIFMR